MVASWRGLEIGKTSNKYEQRVLEGEVNLDNQNLDQPKWWLAGLIDKVKLEKFESNPRTNLNGGELERIKV